MHIFDDFDGGFHNHWTQVTTGGGKLDISKSVLRMGFDGAQAGKYTDAQIDDYTMVSKADYIWKPPLRMTVRARSSHPAADARSTEKTKGILRGTAGFGFWNKPFTMQGNWFTFPQSIWFFYSAPPSDMAFIPGIPGWGWKAQVIHTTPGSVLTHGLPLALTAGHARMSGNVGRAGHFMKRFVGAEEAIVTEDMTKWHTYTLEWHKNESVFWVDDRCILSTPLSPSGALGFVAWLDNEYAVATPKGELRFGKTATGAQWLDMDSVKIEKLAK